MLSSITRGRNCKREASSIDKYPALPALVDSKYYQELAWVQSMDASDTASFEVRALRTTVLAQKTEIIGLRAADRTRQAQLVEILRLMRTL
ncbi:hypothetical protein Tco_0797502 [Tanacetum coccineum]